MSHEQPKKPAQGQGTSPLLLSATTQHQQEQQHNNNLIHQAARSFRHYTMFVDILLVIENQQEPVSTALRQLVEPFHDQCLRDLHHNIGALAFVPHTSIWSPDLNLSRRVRDGLLALFMRFLSLPTRPATPPPRPPRSPTPTLVDGQFAYDPMLGTRAEACRDYQDFRLLEDLILAHQLLSNGRKIALIRFLRPEKRKRKDIMMTFPNQ